MQIKMMKALNRFSPCISLLVVALLFQTGYTLRCQTNPEINASRLEKTLITLATFGRDENGAPNRVAFSDGDIMGRGYVISLMQEAGLQVKIDAAANIIGFRDGTEPGLKPIAFGSHIDMVPHGGNYDGCAGSLSAIEVIKVLKENNINTRHPLEVILFSNEEGGVMGSRAIAGELKPEALSVRNSTGYSMGEGIERLGGDTTKLDEVIREPGSLTAFLELHIEQGGILDREGLDIGVVEGIVGLSWWDVTFTGRANHAGTTPMNMRQDALLAAARFIQAVNEEALSLKGSQVATVGRISATPGAPNVIPGEVKLSLEIRDISEGVIDALYQKIEARGHQIAENSNLSVSFEKLDTTGKPALTDTRIQGIIEQEAQLLKYSTKRMQSGAGHDAQDMAVIVPTGMIFVPSEGGISHAPDEFTHPEELGKGAQVLLNTLLRIDREWN
jgi:N-carbamoyl-L-amino-acid hydrolase